jgi:type VI secretion system ImpA family protein
MAATETIPVATVDAAIKRVIDACVLTPIEGAKPCGIDIRGLRLWVDLRTARPKAAEAGSDGVWQRANPVATDWTSYGESVEQALCTQSKDLELGLFLTEARTRVHGFAGARDGLWMLCGLIEQFADQGLFPVIEDGDSETQYGPLHWLNEKFSEVLHGLDLTRNPEEPNYSLNYRIEAFAPQGGMITMAQWDEAAMAGSVPAYEELLGLIIGTATELSRLKAIVVQHYGEDALSFSQTQETLASCREAVEGFLRRLAPNEDAKGTANPMLLGRAFKGPPDNGRPGASVPDAWEDCERLARTGQIDMALSGMAALAAAEPNGRIRFQRKLLLADLCLQTNRKKLGTSILQELNEIIENHKLEGWETSEMVGGVWARLVSCYRDKAAGTADQDRESEFYLKLSRLDPWQALACGEPARKE